MKIFAVFFFLIYWTSCETRYELFVNECMSRETYIDHRCAESTKAHVTPPEITRPP